MKYQKKYTHIKSLLNIIQTPASYIYKNYVSSCITYTPKNISLLLVFFVSLHHILFSLRHRNYLPKKKFSINPLPASLLTWKSSFLYSSLIFFLRDPLLHYILYISPARKNIYDDSLRVRVNNFV